MLVTSSLICGYGRQMAIKFCIETGFYCNFGCLIRCQGLMDARTLPGAENCGLYRQKVSKKPPKNERSGFLGGLFFVMGQFEGTKTCKVGGVDPQGVV